MANDSTHPDQAIAFGIKDCAMITLATGVKAQNLREFRDCLSRVPPASIYHHFWGRLLRPLFDEPEYNNDFASWASHGLHDKPIAEQLSMVLPTDYDDLDGLRQEIIEVVEQRLEESELVPWSQRDEQFYFLKSQLVVFDTGIRCDTPEQLAPLIPTLSTGSVYYHFIDARSRTDERKDDFSAWVKGIGNQYHCLAEALCNVDPYFSSLKEIRQIVHKIFQQHCPETP